MVVEAAAVLLLHEEIVFGDLPEVRLLPPLLVVAVLDYKLMVAVLLRQLVVQVVLVAEVVAVAAEQEEPLAVLAVADVFFCTTNN
jgi:hypothetical protein